LYTSVVSQYVIRFFFQAEDGIRDFHVTGVQTCALPISQARTIFGKDYGEVTGKVDCTNGIFTVMYIGWMQTRFTAIFTRPAWRQIGRASCRERVLISVEAE